MAPNPAKSPLKKPTRTRQVSQEIECDVFKLLVAVTQKHIGWKKEASPADWEAAEHVHFFRTFSSDGKAQTYCNDVAGHTHLCKVKMGDDGNAALDGEGHLQLEVGPPVRRTIMKTGMGRKIGFQPCFMYVGEDKENGQPKDVFDEHKHKAIYLKSSVISTGQVSVEAANIAATISAQTEPKFPDGSLG